MHTLPHEAAIRLGCFAAILLLMAVWEILAPRRHTITRQAPRWLSNLGLAVLNTLAVRFLVPLGVTGVAVVAEENGWGLLQQVAWPEWCRVVVAVVLLDLAIYLQHVLSARVAGSRCAARSRHAGHASRSPFRRHA